MKKNLITATALIAGLICGGVNHGAFAQGAPQPVVQYSVDVAKVSNGYRASKIIGASVYNEAKEKIGEVDDLIVNRDDRVPYATISVGGFLGVGEKLVVIAFASLKVGADGMVFPGATKASLKDLPKFVYAK